VTVPSGRAEVAELAEGGTAALAESLAAGVSSALGSERWLKPTATAAMMRSTRRRRPPRRTKRRGRLDGARRAAS
jgi:hypothetical protein